MLEKIKNFYGSHPIRWTLLTLLVIVVAGLLIFYAPAFRMTASDIPAMDIPATDKGELITVGMTSDKKRKAEPVVIAEQAGRTLTLDPAEMIFTLEDENGATWSTAIADSTESADKALLMVEFVGENNVFTTFNSYDNGTMLYSTTSTVDPVTGEETSVSTFYDKIYRIENGVRIEMRILDNTKKLLAYMPRTLSQESYQFFMDRIAELEAAGVEVKYQNVFERYWRADPSDPTKYPFQTAGDSANPDADRQIIALAEQVGYTREMLLADCNKYGHTALSPQLADFALTLEITLDENGELIARIPTNEIVTNNPYFKLQRIHVLPNLCAANSTTVQVDENGNPVKDKNNKIVTAKSEGYFLVPDGAGALLQFSSSDGTVADVKRPFMNNDYHQDYYWQSEYSEELMMPIYGVMYGGEETTHGMLAIIEEGEETANLHVSIAQATTGKNKAYVSLDTIEHHWVRIYGAYADNTASYLADSGHIVTDFTIRFIPYDGPVTYYDMAMSYRDYLAEKSGKTIEAPEGPALYLEMLGAVTLTERFVGVPYDSIRSMTTYAQAQEIIEALKGTGSSFQYDGAFNGGVMSGLNDGAKLVAENGEESELASLLETAREADSDLMLQLNISRVYDNGRSYIPYLHAARDYSNAPMEVYLYRADTAQMNGRWDPIRQYTVVSPRYFSHLAESFKAEQNASATLQGVNLSIGDLPNEVFADYRYHDVIDPVEARALALDALNTLSGDGVTALNDPFADVAATGDYALNISRESSNYASYYATVPFRQLALSGLTSVVGEDVNLGSRNLNYYLLQAAELGTSVKYTVSYENPDVLKNSHLEAMYAIHWEAWQEEILAAANACAELRGIIGGKAIIGHEMLKPQVFQTTYEGGVTVITNYSALPYESTNGTVEAGSYLLTTAAQEGGAL